VTSLLRPLFATSFSEVPAVQQQRLVEEFRKVLPLTRLVPWQVGDPFPEATLVLLALSISWNRYEMELASALDEASAEGRIGDDTIAVLPVEDMRDAETIDELFPGLADPPTQTPHLAVWDHCEAFVVSAGAAATAFVSDRYGLSLP
jgi:hypothetical protein